MAGPLSFCKSWSTILALPPQRPCHLDTCPGRSSHSPVYFYEFQRRPNYWKDIKPSHVKADHSDEFPFVFRSYFWGNQVTLTEEEELLSRRMMKYWANFARTGNPNVEGLPHWPVLDQKEQYLQLSTQPVVGRALNAHRRRSGPRPHSGADVG